MSTTLRTDQITTWCWHVATEGVITEHLHLVEDIRTLASGNQVVVLDGAAYPILCSELVEVSTEDGPQVVRCGGRVQGDDVACPGHQEQIDGWRAQSPLDVIEWERRMEEVGA